LNRSAEALRHPKAFRIPELKRQPEPQADISELKRQPEPQAGILELKRRYLTA
jgi:hypothetical protein